MDAIRRALVEALGHEVNGYAETAGGDVNRAARAVLADGTPVFVKFRDDAPAGLYVAEAAGLERLRTATDLRVPGVLAVRDTPPRLLALEWIDMAASRARDHDEVLGAGLAALHRATAERFGGVGSFLATLDQDNTPGDTWVDFYRSRRIGPLVRSLADRQVLPPGLVGDLDRFISRLDRFAGAPEPPALVHGDLWGGNVIRDADGMPVLIDPAVYHGHREMDLAMMRLFGGFGPRVFAVYDAAFPLSAGHEERVAMWQVWPLLVHAWLFGPSWVPQVERAVGPYVR